MKARKSVTRWASLAEAAALVLTGWTIVSYGTGPGTATVLLALRG